MKTRIMKITRQMPEWEVVSVAASVIDGGGIVCLPTDTIYGFAASIYCRQAVDRLRALKGRAAGDPFVIMISDMGLVQELASGITARHRRLIEAYWPGPLTIVFPASPHVPDYVTGADGTVALRIPNDPLAQSLLRACGMPLASPSANVRGRRPALNPEEVLKYFSGQIDLLLDGGFMESPEPSTIVAVRARSLKVLRRGKVSLGKVRG
jgi:L-threonylcarbamoyladenylate synthase